MNSQKISVRAGCFSVYETRHVIPTQSKMKYISLYISIAILLTGCFQTNRLVCLVKFDGKYGYIDKKGKWIVEPIYDSLGVFYKGYATSYLNGKEGIINRKGKLIVNHNFDFIGHVEDGIALIITKGEQVNYINTKGQIISKHDFYDGESFGNGLAPVQFTHKGKWGYINTAGKIVIDTIYDHASIFKNGRANVEIERLELVINLQGRVTDTLKIQRGNFTLIGYSDLNTLGKINSTGDTIMPMIYKSFGYPQGRYFWFNNGTCYGLADTTGMIISGTRYEYLSYFSDNGLALAKLNGKYGYINKNCEKVIDFVFQNAQGFKYNLAAVQKDGKWGFINERGELRIAYQFENVAHQFRPIDAAYEPMYHFDE